LKEEESSGLKTKIEAAEKALKDSSQTSEGLKQLAEDLDAARQGLHGTIKDLYRTAAKEAGPRTEGMLFG